MSLCRPRRTANGTGRKRVKGDTLLKTISCRKLAKTCQAVWMPGEVSKWPKLLLLYSMWLQATDERQVCSLRTLNNWQEMDEVGIWSKSNEFGFDRLLNILCVSHYGLKKKKKLNYFHLVSTQKRLINFYSTRSVLWFCHAVSRKHLSVKLCRREGGGMRDEIQINIKKETEKKKKETVLLFYYRMFVLSFFVSTYFQVIYFKLFIVVVSSPNLMNAKMNAMC